MQAMTAKYVHELFVERFNAQDVGGIMELFELSSSRILRYCIRVGQFVAPDLTELQSMWEELLLNSSPPDRR